MCTWTKTTWMRKGSPADQGHSRITEGVELPAPLPPCRILVSQVYRDGATMSSYHRQQTVLVSLAPSEVLPSSSATALGLLTLGSFLGVMISVVCPCSASLGPGNSPDPTLHSSRRSWLTDSAAACRERRQPSNHPWAKMIQRPVSRVSCSQPYAYPHHVSAQ